MNPETARAIQAHLDTLCGFTVVRKKEPPRYCCMHPKHGGECSVLPFQQGNEFLLIVFRSEPRIDNIRKAQP